MPVPPRDDDRNPPSFTPGGERARPTPDGARVVGSSRPRPVAPERVVRRAPDGPDAASSPRRSSARSAGGADTSTPGRTPASFAPSTPGSSTPGSFAPAGRRPAVTSPAARSASATRPARPAPGGTTPAPGRPTAPVAPRPRRRRRGLRVGLVLALVVLLAWPVGLLIWADGLLQHTPALSGAAGTRGTTYLLAGSDARGDEGGVADDGTEGHRTDTILLLHVPGDGPTALISLPRDSYVEVPGHGWSKLNSAFAWGGAPLLVQTVEGFTGLTVDHYAEIGMGGVTRLVDAMGGVDLCYDHDVNDPESGMVWTAGCHEVDGAGALAFARMRKSDPQGDVGRALRQRQLIAATLGRVSPRSLVLNPGAQVALVDGGTSAFTFDESTGVLDVARLALAFRAASGPDGITGTPPIASMDHRPGGVGSTVLLDPDRTPEFFAAIRDGSLPVGPVGGAPTG